MSPWCANPNPHGWHMVYVESPLEVAQVPSEHPETWRVEFSQTIQPSFCPGVEQAGVPCIECGWMAYPDNYECACSR